MSDTDTREKLEADIAQAFDGWEENGAIGDRLGWSMCVVARGWLNRQAAITERHWMEICGANANAAIEVNKKRADLQAKVDELTAEVKRWADAANEQRLCAMEQAKKAFDLEAERDEYRKSAEDNMELAMKRHQRAMAVTAERDRLERENAKLRDRLAEVARVASV